MTMQLLTTNSSKALGSNLAKRWALHRLESSVNHACCVSAPVLPLQFPVCTHSLARFVPYLPPHQFNHTEKDGLRLPPEIPRPARLQMRHCVYPAASRASRAMR
jgi:hypothetical protein